MAQGDYLIQNQSFPSFRSDLNSTLEAINTSNSGTSRPSSAVAGTVWLDTTNATNPTLKFFDGTDDISLAQLDYTANTVNWLDSTVTISPLTTDLDVGGNAIVSSSNGNITFTPDGTGKVIIDGLSHPTADGTSGQNIITDGAGNLSFSNVIPADNTVSLDKLTATGTKDATTFLRGDNSFQEVPAGGITMVDMWRMTAHLNSNVDPISANLERVDDATFAKIGTGMTESSGTFSFPETGLYEVHFNYYGESNGDGYNTFIKFTSDNSTYTTVAGQSVGESSGYNVTGGFGTIFNVTDITNDKVRFATSGMAGNNNTMIYGDTSQSLTYFQFIRLGDSQ